MAAQFDISSLFRQAFGLGRGVPYDASRVNQQEFTKAPKFPDALSGDNLEGNEFVNVRSAISANLPTGKPIFMPVKIGDFVLPNEPSISFVSRKNIVSTPLTGSTRRGTVKELINIEDWVITIRGIAINFDSKNFYPEDQVKGLNDLYNKNEALPIQCALTSLLGIYRVVIREFQLPEMVGIQHAQAYQFVLESDEDFILEL